MPKAKLPVITDLDNLKGKRVLLRCPFNVPINSEGEVTNQFRVLRSIATINYLVREKSRVILISHISSSKESERDDSLQPVYELLKTYIPDIKFSPEVVSPKTTAMCEDLGEGEVILLENLRQDPREKKNDADFARSLADLADIFVNNDFAVSHREHASIVGVTEFLPSYAGINFQHEYEELQKAMKPKKPSLFMLGGAKFDTKQPLIEKYLDVYDQVFVAGALANDFFRAAGYKVGQSLVSKEEPNNIAKLSKKENLLLPIDVTVIGDNGVRSCLPEAVEEHETITDMGPATTKMLSHHIEKAKTILWNGPFGNYEKGFDKETIEVAKLVANSSAYSVVGGGDTIAAIESLNCQEQFGFLSTAGGAMLTYLEHGDLPGIKALKQSKHD